MSFSIQSNNEHLNKFIVQILKDNERLQQCLCQAEKEKDEIKNNYMKILQANTDKYENEIEDLKNQLRKKDIEIKELKERIQKLQEELDDKSNKITQLENKVGKLEAKHELDLITIAIQDINACDELERNRNIRGKRYLRRIRKRRNSNCHCILEDDNTELINYKKHLALNRLNSLPSITKEEFIKRYSDVLLNDLIKHLENQSLEFRNLPEEDKEDADFWWDN